MTFVFIFLVFAVTSVMNAVCSSVVSVNLSSGYEWLPSSSFTNVFMFAFLGDPHTSKSDVHVTDRSYNSAAVRWSFLWPWWRQWVVDVVSIFWAVTCDFLMSLSPFWILYEMSHWQKFLMRLCSGNCDAKSLSLSLSPWPTWRSEKPPVWESWLPPSASHRLRQSPRPGGPGGEREGDRGQQVS